MLVSVVVLSLNPPKKHMYSERNLQFSWAVISESLAWGSLCILESIADEE